MASAFATAPSDAQRQQEAQAEEMEYQIESNAQSTSQLQPHGQQQDQQAPAWLQYAPASGEQQQTADQQQYSEQAAWDPAYAQQYEASPYDPQHQQGQYAYDSQPQPSSSPLMPSPDSTGLPTPNMSQDEAALASLQQQGQAQYQHQEQEESKENDQSPPATALAGQRYPHSSYQHQPQPPFTYNAFAPSSNLFDVGALDAAAHRAIESDDEVVLSEFLVLLENHRQECERKSLYVEASLAKNKIDELRQHEEARRRASLQVAHLAARVQLEQAHLLEFDEFNSVWAQRLAAFDEVTAQRKQELRVRHLEELEQWMSAEQQRILLRPKFSKSLLHMRAMQEGFARGRDYAQAERVRLQANEMEHFELEALKAGWAGKMHSKRQKLLAAQALELDGYLVRRRDERTQMAHRKLHELRTCIVQKYRNLKGELELAQSKEVALANKMAEHGISGSAFLREHAPKHSKPLSSHPVPTSPKSSQGQGPNANNFMPATSAMFGKTRLQSSGLKHGQQQGQQGQHAGGWGLPWTGAGTRSVEDEEAALLREAEAEEASSALLSGQGTSAEEVPTIASALAGQGGASRKASPRPPSSSSGAAAGNSHATSNGWPAEHSATRPSSQHLLMRHTHPSGGPSGQASLPATRPATSTSYDPTGRRRVVQRAHKSVTSALHYTRPSPRAGNSVDRAREAQDILARIRPPPQVARMQANQPQQQQQQYPASARDRSAPQSPVLQAAPRGLPALSSARSIPRDLRQPSAANARADQDF